MKKAVVKKVRIAIAGCGKIARTRHAPEYTANPNAELVGFYDFNPERSEEMAELFGGKIYESFEELLADESVEAVSICSPNFLHSTHTIQALRAGKHVLCEKPMAATVAEADDQGTKRNRQDPDARSQSAFCSHTYPCKRAA